MGEFIVSNPDLRQNLGDELGATFQELQGKVGEAKAAELKAIVEAAASEAVDNLIEDRTAITAAGLESFASLVDNQPQITFWAQKSFRDKLVGGDETSAKFTYEWGRTNLNDALRGNCDRDLDQPATATIASVTLTKCLDKYADYVHTHKDLLTDGEKFRSLPSTWTSKGKSSTCRPTASPA